MKVSKVSFSFKNAKVNNKYPYLYTGEEVYPVKKDNATKLFKIGIGIVTVSAVLITLSNLRKGKSFIA